MFNDNIIRTPINGTAARVASQGSCSEDQTLLQQRENLASRIHQLSGQMFSLKKGTGAYDIVKAKKVSLEHEISDLNNSLKGVRKGLLDYIFQEMRVQLTQNQYSKIIESAKEKLQKSSLSSKGNAHE